MDKPTAERLEFNRISTLLSELPNVGPGKMMSSDGIRCNKKVFAFFHNNQMCFRLGKDYEITQHQITEWQHLSPFKTKPPLTAWFYVPSQYIQHWEKLALIAKQNLAGSC